MLSWISFLIDRIFVVLGALLFSQIPNFFVHYTQRLGGHVSELKLQIDKMQQVALKSGKTLPEFIHKFQSYPDADVSLQGSIMQDMTSRYKDLSTAYTSMLEATPLTKPLAFIQHLQWNIAQLTLQDFTWGFSLTLEGAIYAFLGMFFGYLIFSTFSYTIKNLFHLSIIKS
jgi:hypothetical protein